MRWERGREGEGGVKGCGSECKTIPEQKSASSEY